MRSPTPILGAVAAIVIAAGVQSAPVPATCPVSHEGQISANATKELFVSSSSSPFNPKYVLGQNLTWDTVQGTKAISLRLDDKSVFRSGSEGVETKLRRAELLVNKKDPTVSGHKSWHLSFRTDPSHPLNYTHEYILAFHEAQNFQADFWSIKTGDFLESTNPQPRKTTLFEVPLTDGEWHNFGIELNFPQNLISVYYSTCDNPLELVVPPTHVQQHLGNPADNPRGDPGLQKRPTDSNINDFLFNGTQPSGINEAFIFGGIFQDDSVDGCVSL
ncbi:glycoside hydrolase family 131 protein [Gonapodya prolifera JEL478]|uniref:Glycoside hydrolase family 131 protein n=1 Tax=Gonapodya prolifera (strain JEL478) TaxID=1344416 RepID=A0A139ASB8_GONPJ|nr:glycoside hydrolase family 131 protein [Gonapodya prolifera JEL478]|eukprot:KXS19599.1 glycoside hydrolase family 131 protein [Gonapodya prolifera JEL478]